MDYCFDNYTQLSDNSTKTLDLTEQNNLLSDTPPTPPSSDTVPSDSEETLIDAVQGHSWQDYALIVAIGLAAVILLVLIIRQSVIYAKRRRRRKNYERMKQQRLEEEHQKED